MVRFVHTADWQLGRRFERIPGDHGAALRLQRLETVNRIGELAVERRADAVLVAGDVFDMNTVHDDTIQRTLRVLSRHDVDWVLLPGNHDAATAESVWTRIERMGRPARVHLATTNEPIILAEGALCVLPAPLTQRRETRDLTEWWDSVETPNQVVRVGLAHGSMADRLPMASEAANPIAADRVTRAQLDYLALGDWHGTLEIADRAFYSGTPECDRFRNNDSGQVLWVEIEGPAKNVHVERIAVGHYRWSLVEFSLHGSADLDALAARLAALPEPHERCLVSLRLGGAVDLQTQHDLEMRIRRWRPTFHYLAVNDRELIARPSSDDLTQLGGIGFVTSAVERLLEIQNDPNHPEHSHAAHALSLLYAAYQRAESS